MVDFSFLNLIMLFLKFAFILRINYFIFWKKTTTEGARALY